MDIYDIIKTRYSVREYRDTPVEDGKLGRILEAARLAPTAANRQAFEIIIARTEGRKEELLEIYTKDWFVQAPLIIAVCGETRRGWTSSEGRSYIPVDTAIVMDHIILAATNEGLGTCWIAAFNPAAARKILHIRPDLDPVVMTPLGYAADLPKPKKRKPVSEIISFWP